MSMLERRMMSDEKCGQLHCLVAIVSLLPPLVTLFVSTHQITHSVADSSWNSFMHFRLKSTQYSQMRASGGY
jgi:hypothetical protein